VKFLELALELIRGPTHITQTDIWVSRGGTLSVFKRRVDWASGNWCREEAHRYCRKEEVHSRCVVS